MNKVKRLSSPTVRTNLVQNLWLCFHPSAGARVRAVLICDLRTLMTVWRPKVIFNPVLWGPSACCIESLPQKLNSDGESHLVDRVIITSGILFCSVFHSLSSLFSLLPSFHTPFPRFLPLSLPLPSSSRSPAYSRWIRGGFEVANPHLRPVKKPSKTLFDLIENILSTALIWTLEPLNSKTSWFLWFTLISPKLQYAEKK